MPAVSEAQRRKLNATFGHKWVRRHHFDNRGKLPERVGEQTKEGSLMLAVAAQAAEQPFIEKLASDASISEELIRHLAARCNLAVVPFVKAAYANVDDFLDVLRAAAGVAPLTKTADLKTLLGRFLSNAGQAGKAAIGKPSTLTSPMFGPSSPQGGVSGFLAKNAPLGGSRAGRIATLGGGGGLATAGAVNMMGSGGGGEAPKGPVAAAVDAATNPAAQAGGAAPGAPGAAPASPGAAPAAPGGSPAAPGGAKGQGAGKMLGLGAAGLAGGAGVAALINRRRKKSQPAKTASARDLAVASMRRAIVKKAADLYREEAKQTFCTYLDKVAALMPIERTGEIRTIQKEVATGKTLAHAIKVAYPNLIPEKRGILAAEMVRKAAAWKKQANAGCAPSSGPQSWNGPLAGASEAMAGMTGSPGMTMGA